MSNVNPDQRIRELFNAQRDCDARRAPPFARVVTGARPAALEPANRRWSLLIGTVAAAAAIAAAATVGLRSFTRPAPSTIPSWQWLSDWQAQSDGLLSVAETPWAETIHVASDGWFDELGNINTDPYNPTEVL